MMMAKRKPLLCTCLQLYSLPSTMSSATPLLDNTIEADIDDTPAIPQGNINNANTATRTAPVVLTPGSQLATTESEAEAGKILRYACFSTKSLVFI